MPFISLSSYFETQQLWGNSLWIVYLGDIDFDVASFPICSGDPVEQIDKGF